MKDTNPRLTTMPTTLASNKPELSLKRLTLTFPGEINQTGHNTVEITLGPGCVDPFNEGFYSYIVEQLGARHADQFADEMSAYITKKLIIAQIA